MGTWGGLQDVGVAIARVFEMMAKTPEERVHSGDSMPPAAPAEGLAFDDLTFAYDMRASVLKAVTLHARVGETTAIAGPSGSGKSTIISMMLRFFDPEAAGLLLTVATFASCVSMRTAR